MKKISIIFITFIFLGFSSICAYAAIPAHERAALIALYNSTNGDTWTNNSGWKDGTLEPDGFGPIGSENTWLGITCDVNNTTVLTIKQFQNNLVGTIPKELGNLSNLTVLALDHNQLSGPIPPELRGLINLQQLYTLHNTTVDKTVSQMEVTGLVPDTTYYFVIQTRSNQYNQNYVDSEYSREVSMTIVTRITVTSPKTNEVYNVRNTIAIEWSTIDLSGYVDIRLRGTDEPGDYLVKEKHPFDGSPLEYIVANDVLRGIYYIEIRQGTVSGRSGNFYIASESSVIRVISPGKG